MAQYFSDTIRKVQFAPSKIINQCWDLCRSVVFNRIVELPQQGVSCKRKFSHRSKLPLMFHILFFVTLYYGFKVMCEGSLLPINVLYINKIHIRNYLVSLFFASSAKD